MVTIIREELRSHYKFQRDCLNIRALTNSSFSYKNERSDINFFRLSMELKSFLEIFLNTFSQVLKT